MSITLKEKKFIEDLVGFIVAYNEEDRQESVTTSNRDEVCEEEEDIYKFDLNF